MNILNINEYFLLNIWCIYKIDLFFVCIHLIFFLNSKYKNMYFLKFANFLCIDLILILISIFW